MKTIQPMEHRGSILHLERDARAVTQDSGADRFDRLLHALAGSTWCLPVLPDIASQLREARRSAAAGECGSSIAQTVISDPTLVGMLVHRAHTRAQPGGARLKTVREAIVRVGVEGLHEFASECFDRVLQVPAYERVLEAVRWHCVATGYLTAFVCQTVSLPNAQGFLCGLLADVGLSVGLLAVAHHAPEGALPELSRVWPALVQAHPALSARVASWWGVDEEITRSLAGHHALRSGAAVEPMAAAVAVAADLAAELGVAAPAPALGNLAGACGAAEIARHTLALSDRQMARLRDEGGRHLASLRGGRRTTTTDHD